MNSTKRRCLMACLCSLIVPLSFQVGQAANPYDSAAGWAAIDSVHGNLGIHFRPFADSLWDPTDTPWNGRNTTAGNKIGNCTYPDTGFDFNVLLADGMGGFVLVNVTAAESDDYWDAAWPGKEMVSGSTFVRNCWGYATGKSYWVTSAGFSTLLADEYDEIDTSCTTGSPGHTSNLEVGDVVSLPGHGQKITYVCNDGTGYCEFVGTIHEKNGSSGVYKTTYYCPGGADPAGDVYRHK